MQFKFTFYLIFYLLIHHKNLSTSHKDLRYLQDVADLLAYWHCGDRQPTLCHPYLYLAQIELCKNAEKFPKYLTTTKISGIFKNAGNLNNQRSQIGKLHLTIFCSVTIKDHLHLRYPLGIAEWMAKMNGSDRKPSGFLANRKFAFNRCSG
jgi:hypothetical protein